MPVQGLTDEQMFGSSAGGASQSGLTDEQMFGAGGAQKPKREAYSEAASAMMGARSGATFDLYDEGAGALGTARDFVSGNVNLSDLVSHYQKLRDKVRMEEKLARQDNPKAYVGGQLAGGLATAFVPGLGWMNAAKGAKLGATLAKGAASGGIAGFGASEGESGREIFEDVRSGAALGAATGGVLKGVGGALKNLQPREAAKKSANIFLNTPEELTELAITRGRDAIEKAPIRADVVKRYQDVLEELKKKVYKGSAKSRKELEGVEINQQYLANRARHLANQRRLQSEGVEFTGPKQAGLQFFDKTADRLKAKPKVIKKGKKTITIPANKRTLSGNRVKTDIQGLDAETRTDYQIAPGRFAKPESVDIKTMRRVFDDILKAKSPAYAEDMAKVAPQTRLLDKANKLGSEKTLANVFRRINTDEFGAGVIPRKIIEQVDAEMGSDIIDQAKMAYAREAFDKSITNGSMNVNKFSNWLQDVPVLKYAAPLIGASVDKYGRKMTLGAIDTAMYLEGVAKKYGYDQLAERAKPFFELAKSGNKAAAIAINMIDSKYKREGLEK